MAIPNPKDYTYNVAKDIQGMLHSFRNLPVDYSDIIKVVNVTDVLFYFQDVNHRDFYFHIGFPDKKSNGTPTLFPMSFAPASHDSIDGTAGEVDKDKIFKYFLTWIKIIQDYNSVSFNQEEAFLKIYEEEIYSDFESIDENATTHPFNNIQQNILYNFLSAASIYLENKHPNDEEVANICSETLDLRDNIQNLTKKDFSKRLSKVFAKIKKFSLQTFLEISDVAKKEIYKYLLKEGVNKLPNWIDDIHTFFILNV